MTPLLAKLRQIAHPGALVARRNLRVVGGGLLVAATAVLLLRAFGIRLDEMAAWLPDVVDRERGAAANAVAAPADLPLDGNVVPPPEDDVDGPAAPEAPDAAAADQPVDGDVIPPDEP
jgi:hypothetical protein